MSGILNKDGGRGEGGATNIMWCGGRGAFGVNGVLRRSGSDVSETLARTAKSVAMERPSSLDKVRCGFTQFLFSANSFRDASFREGINVSWMSVKKRTKASASLSPFSGRDPRAELCAVPLAPIVDVRTDADWNGVNKTSSKKVGVHLLRLRQFVCNCLCCAERVEISSQRPAIGLLNPH